MQIDVGYFYFVKDDFFDIINDPELMKIKKMELKDHVIFVLKVKKTIKLYGSFQLVLKLINIKRYMKIKFKTNKIRKKSINRYNSFWICCKYI